MPESNISNGYAFILNIYQSNFNTVFIFQINDMQLKFKLHLYISNTVSTKTQG